MTGPPVSAASATTVEIGGRTLISFAGCNYLGLAQDRRVLEAAHDALPRFGLSTSASRETSGHTELHAGLEKDLTHFLGVDEALLLPDGYSANLGALQALSAMGVTCALIDDRAHQSLRDAARLAELEVRLFASGDVDDARRKADGVDRERAAILTDGVFTTDGRIARIPELLDLGLRILIDDCHGLGVLGPNGAGSLSHYRLDWVPQIIVTSTLAKGIGCAGGFIAGTSTFVRAARAHASAYICTTPTAPPMVAAAREALRIVNNDSARREKLLANTRAVAGLLDFCGLCPNSDPTPIFAFVPNRDLVAADQAFRQAGVFIPLMKYPHGPWQEYFRLSVSSEHSAQDLRLLEEALNVVRGRVSSGHECRP